MFFSTTYIHANKLIFIFYIFEQKNSNYVIYYIVVHRKNPISFLGVAIGRFVEMNAKSSIDNYFNKGAAKEVKNFNIQLTRPENSTTCSNINRESDNSTLFNEQQFKSKISLPLSNQPPSPLNHSNGKKNKTCINDVKNLKTMFVQMKNSDSFFTNSFSTIQSVDPKKEIKLYKLDKNSFFTKKLEIISPVKNQVNEKITTVDQSSSTSAVGFLFESSDVISPSKNILNDNHNITTQPADSFFSRKLEIVSPSKNQKTNDSRIELVPIVQSTITEDTIECAPITLLCERCDNMIDIDTYEEHIDHHVAIELSESLNIINPVQPLNNKILKSKPTKKKKNERGLKRKQNSIASSSNPKKPCTSISSYFKPLLNP